MEGIKRKILIIFLAAMPLLTIYSGTIVANNQDHKHNTNVEDGGHYSENNNNSFDNDEFPYNE